MKARSILIALLAISMSWTSCKKDKETIALITVVDVDGVALEQVVVKLFPEPSTPQNNELIDEVEQITDAGGQATFDFSEYYEDGQAGFAVLNILASKDTVAVDGIIKIDPETVNEKTVILQ